MTASEGLQSQATTAATPTVRLLPAPRLVLPGRVDANTPVMWSRADGPWILSAITSWGGITSRSVGSRLEALSPAEPVDIRNHPGYGVWMESVVEDDHGTWYGYYHHEVPGFECGRTDLQAPSIRAARSHDQGRTWDDIGEVLTAPLDSHACKSSNAFVLGGVGDVSAALDANKRDLYLYFSQYARDVASQGVGVARLAWADRDEPTGKAAMWNRGAWIPARRGSALSGDVEPRWDHSVGTPLVPATRSWHDGVASADAFWGPSIHWNTHLRLWVMLVNRARNERFDQDGLYVSFAKDVSDPTSWSAPRKFLHGGQWYPQVVGLEPQEGTDRQAGRRARLFITGVSEFYIEFSR